LADFNRKPYPVSQELSSSLALVEVDPYWPAAALWTQPCLDTDANSDVNSTALGPHTAKKQLMQDLGPMRVLK